MQTIQVLPSSLINQIAAGEVIERPANVVKELVENSLDAGATKIDIFLEGGGLKEIKILDNGKGMSQADLLLSTVRHATSKIKEASDLECLSTFGFRGEALSSICSVSDVEIKSQSASETAGFQITVIEGAPSSPPHRIAFSPGTHISVRNLFEKIPGRRKFMRSETTELSHCQNRVKELALGNPHVKFSLKHEGRLLGTWTASSRKTRLQECLKTSLEPFSWVFTRDEASFEFLSFPLQDELPRSELYLFINNRLVRHRPFLAAIRSAFQETLGYTAEPIGACFLELRKDWVDANVHPQKWEVRCLHQESLYQWIYSSLKSQLSKTPQSTSFNPTSAYSNPYSRSSSSLSSSGSCSSPFTFQRAEDVTLTRQFIISETSEGLRIAKRQSLRLKAQFRKLISDSPDSNSQEIPSVGLAVPEVRRLPFFKNEFKLCNLSQILNQLGFAHEDFGDGDLAFSSRPAFLNQSAMGLFLTDFINWLKSLKENKQSCFSFEKVTEWLLLWLEDHPEACDFPYYGSTQMEIDEFRRALFSDKEIVLVPYSSFKTPSLEI